MKIVQINSVYGISSTGVIVQDIFHICQKNGIACLVTCAEPHESDNISFIFDSVINKKLHSLLLRISGQQGYYSIFETKRFLRFLDKEKPNILHIHNLHSSFINLPLLLKYVAEKDIPLVVTLHDCWYYTGGCTHYTHSNCAKWKFACGNCPQRYEEFPAFLCDRSNKILSDRKRLFGNIKNVTAVGVSQWIVEEAKQNVFKNAKCITIHNGIDLDFFHPVDSDFRKRYMLEDKFVILAPANKWFLEINRDTLLFFSKKLSNNICMVFIGNGCDETYLTDHMINIGFVSSREEIRAIYSAADVLVNCTREESLSLLNVETQACGTPVVTYANTGVKETVDGKCGFAVENGNPEALWNATMVIYSQGKTSFSDECRTWVKQKFDKTVNYQKYVALYKDIVKMHNIT